MTTSHATTLAHAIVAPSHATKGRRAELLEHQSRLCIHASDHTKITKIFWSHIFASGMFPSAGLESRIPKRPVNVLGGLLLGEYSWRSGRAAISSNAKKLLSSPEKAAEAVADKAKELPSQAKRAIQTVFHIDADREHDKKLDGVQIDIELTGRKERLRALRDAVHDALKLYEHHVEMRKLERWALLLPELSDWARHEQFCGADEVADALHRGAQQASSIAERLASLRGTITHGTIAQLRQAERAVLAGLDVVMTHELKLRDAVKAHEAAQERLNSTNAAMMTARAEREATTAAGAPGGDARTAKAVVAAERAVAAALESIDEAKGAVVSSGAELVRLERDEVPLALRAADEAQQEAEATYLAAACASLAGAYEALAREVDGARAHARSLPWRQPVRKPLPVDGGKHERFAELEGRWQLALQRCEAAARTVGAWRQGGLAAVVAPPAELEALHALRTAVGSAQVEAQLDALLVSADVLAQARQSCDAAVGALQAALGAMCAELKTCCAVAREWHATSKQYRATSARIERLGKHSAADHAASELSAKMSVSVPVDTTGDGKVDALAFDSNRDGSLDTIVKGKEREKLLELVRDNERRKAELAGAIELATGLRQKLDHSASEIERLAVATSAYCAGSELRRLAEAVGACVHEYGTYCASRRHSSASTPGAADGRKATLPALTELTLSSAASYLAVDAPSMVTHPSRRGSSDANPDRAAPPNGAAPGKTICEALGTCTRELCTILRFTPAPNVKRTNSTFII